MRDLNQINPRFAYPAHVVILGAFLSLLMIIMSLGLVIGITPDIPFKQNPISQILLGILFISIALAPIPTLLKWGWSTKSYFITLFVYLSTVAFIYWTPLFCLLLYSQLPQALSLVFLLTNILISYWWCRRFVRYYQHIYQSPDLWQCLYEEEEDAIYYMRKGDDILLNKKFKFAQTPPSWLFVLLTLAVIPALFFIRSLILWTGLPLHHIVLTIIGLPISLMVLGVATKSYLLYGYYPWLIKRKSGKNVYIDMGSYPKNLDNLKGKKFRLSDVL